MRMDIFMLPNNEKVFFYSEYSYSSYLIIAMSIFISDCGYVSVFSLTL